MRTKPIRRTPVQWREILAQFEHSGQTQSTFCQQHGLAPATFSKWRQRLLSDDVADNPTAFVEVVTVQDAVDSAGISIYLGDDICVQCPSTMSLPAIAALAKALHHG